MRVGIVFLLAFTEVVENWIAAHPHGGALACRKLNSRCINSKRYEFSRISRISESSEDRTKPEMAVTTKQDHILTGITTNSVMKAKSINELGDKFCVNPSICKKKSRIKAGESQSNNQIVERIPISSTPRHRNNTVTKTLKALNLRTKKSKKKIINPYSKRPIDKIPNFKADFKLNSKKKSAKNGDKRSNKGVNLKPKVRLLRRTTIMMPHRVSTLRPLKNFKSSASGSTKKMSPTKMNDHGIGYKKKIFARRNVLISQILSSNKTLQESERLRRKSANEDHNRKRASRESKNFHCEKRIPEKTKRSNWNYVRQDFGSYIPMGCPTIKITNICSNDPCDSGEESPMESSVSSGIPAEADADLPSGDSPEASPENFRSDGSDFHRRLPQKEMNSRNTSLDTKNFEEFFGDLEGSQQDSDSLEFPYGPNDESPFADIDGHRPKSPESSVSFDEIPSQPDFSSFFSNGQPLETHPFESMDFSVVTKKPENPTQDFVASIAQAKDDVNKDNRKEKINSKFESTGTVLETKKTMSNIQEDYNTNDEKNVSEEGDEDNEDEEDDDYNDEEYDENGD